MSHRNEQIASVLHRAIQQTLAKGLADPRIRGVITITGVKLSPDARTAAVSVSIIPEEHERLTMHGLQSAARHIRRNVGELVDMAVVPDLNFKLDRSLKAQAAVIQSIAQASAELDSRAAQARAAQPPRDAAAPDPENPQ